VRACVRPRTLTRRQMVEHVGFVSVLRCVANPNCKANEINHVTSVSYLDEDSD